MVLRTSGARRLFGLDSRPMIDGLWPQLKSKPSQYPPRFFLARPVGVARLVFTYRSTNKGFLAAGARSLLLPRDSAKLEARWLGLSLSLSWEVIHSGTMTALMSP